VRGGSPFELRRRPSASVCGKADHHVNDHESALTPHDLLVDVGIGQALATI
jgi:hypothetical protein